jgi:hypothetical protein
VSDSERAAKRRRSSILSLLGLAAFVAVFVSYFWTRSHIWEGIQSATNAEYVLWHHQPSTGIFFWSLVGFTIQGVVTYLVMLWTLGSGGSRRLVAANFIAALLAASNLFLIFASIPGRNSRPSAGTAFTIMEGSDVGILTAYMFAAVIHTAAAMFAILLVVGLCIHKLSRQVRLVIGVCSVPCAAVLAALLFGREYVSWF